MLVFFLISLTVNRLTVLIKQPHRVLQLLVVVIVFVIFLVLHVLLFSCQILLVPFVHIMHPRA